MFQLIAIDFSQKFPHFSLLSPTSPCELSEREVTSPSNLKVVGALSRSKQAPASYYDSFKTDCIGDHGNLTSNVN
jgi:hypothetical protein